MKPILLNDRSEYITGEASAAWAVDDPVYLYIADMIADLGDMAANAGYAGLGLRLREVLTPPLLAA